MPAIPVELHVVSDATGETAARLVQALEAQFPDQDFVEIRHPRVESEDDLQLAVSRMRGRPASKKRRGTKSREVGRRRSSECYEVLDLGNSKSGGLETRGQVERFGTIVAK